MLETDAFLSRRQARGAEHMLEPRDEKEDDFSDGDDSNDDINATAAVTIQIQSVQSAPCAWPTQHQRPRRGRRHEVKKRTLARREFQPCCRCPSYLLCAPSGAIDWTDGRVVAVGRCLDDYNTYQVRAGFFREGVSLPDLSEKTRPCTSRGRLGRSRGA